MFDLILVEDHYDLRQLWQLALAPKYKAALAANGKEALDLLAENPRILALVSDLHLPDMSGLELIKSFRLSHPQLPALLITGDGSEAYKEAEKLPHTKCLLKPVGLKELIATIDSLVPKSSAH